MREANTGKLYVFECNPRGSSFLEVVSGKPAWGSAFFRVDMREHSQYQKYGFLVHRNC